MFKELSLLLKYVVEIGIQQLEKKTSKGRAWEKIKINHSEMRILQKMNFSEANKQNIIIIDLKMLIFHHRGSVLSA